MVNRHGDGDGHNESKVSGLNWIHFVWLKLSGISLPGLCTCIALATGCTYPSTINSGDRFASGSPVAQLSAAAGPRFNQVGPDAEEYGASERYPVGERGACQRIGFLVGCQSHFDRVYEARVVRRATTASELKPAASEPAIRYEYEAQTFTIDDYLARNPTTGLLIAQGGTILVERYQYARHERHRFTSWSMAKTVTTMLVGIATRTVTSIL
jgi:hypothetical protein